MAGKNGDEDFADNKDRQTKPVERVFVLAHNCLDRAENKSQVAGVNTRLHVQQRAAGTEKHAVSDGFFPIVAKQFLDCWMIKALPRNKVEGADV